MCAVKQQPQEQPSKSHKQDILQKHLQINQSIFVSYTMHTTLILPLWGFLCIRDAGRRGNKITVTDIV